MTPWLRTLRVAGLLLVLATGAVPTAYAAEPAPAVSRAGSLAGEGRERPGREDPAVQEDDGEAEIEGQDPRSDATVAPEPSRNAAIPVRQSVLPAAPAEEAVLRIVPLGSGLILVGLGLGLAFLALRVRRG